MTRLSLILVLLLGQDPAKFEARSAVGDRTTIKIESSLTLQITVKDSGESRSRTMTLDAQEEFRQEVLAAEGGEARKVRVTCPRSSRNKTVGNDTQSWGTALQGMTFLVVLGAEAKVEVEGGGEVPKGTEAVGSWNAFPRLLPKEPKKVGDSWKIGARDVAPALWVGFEEAAGELEVKLDRVEQNRATFLVSGRILDQARRKDREKAAEERKKRGENTAEIQDDVLELKDSTFVFDVSTGRPVSFSMSGSLSLIQEVADRRPKPGSLTEEIEVVHGEVTVKSTRMTVSVKFE